MTLLKRLAIVVVVVAALAGIADRCLWWLAQDYAASALAERGATNPRVQIHGFPFLTQVATHTLDDVEIDADELHLDETGNLQRLHMRAHDVDLDYANGTVRTIGSLTATGRLPLATIADSANKSADGKGTVRVDGDRLVASIPTAVGTLRADVGFTRHDPVDNKPTIGLTLSNFHSDNPLVSALTQGFSTPAIPVPLTKAPAGLDLTGVTKDGDGLLVNVTGHNLTVAR